MAATASQFYFRFCFSWVRLFGEVEIYLQTKFRRDISIHGWDITTSGLWKQTYAVLEFHIISDLDFHVCIIMDVCICLANFVQIRPSAVELWRHSDFQDGSRPPYWIFSRVTANHPRSANESLCVILKFRLDRIYTLCLRKKRHYCLVWSSVLSTRPSMSGMDGCTPVWELMDNTSNICSEPQTSLFAWFYCFTLLTCTSWLARCQIVACFTRYSCNM